MGLIFNEESLLNGNIFKYEQRLKSHVSKYIENGAILTTYYHLADDAVTVDRGFRDIEQLFGRQSPLRFNRILNFPLYGFGQANPANTDEAQLEDFNVEGECQVMMATIVPSQNDFFTVNHLKMIAVFQVVEVTYDSMKAEGYYKLRYRLISNSQETMENLDRQTVGHYRCQLEALGTDANPIVTEDDAVRRSQLMKLIGNLIEDYRATFYNERHNCFLLTGTGDHYHRWFDMCANEFIAKHSLMNLPNSPNVLSLHHKLNDRLATARYRRSIYRWLEDDAPLSGLEAFELSTLPAGNYIDSSFHRWRDDDIEVLVPLEGDRSACSFFNAEQLSYYRDEGKVVAGNAFDQLMKLFIRGQLTSIQQLPLSLGDDLRYGSDDRFTFLTTPVVIYLIRRTMRLD